MNESDSLPILPLSSSFVRDAHFPLSCFEKVHIAYLFFFFFFQKATNIDINKSCGLLDQTHSGRDVLITWTSPRSSGTFLSMCRTLSARSLPGIRGHFTYTYTPTAEDRGKKKERRRSRGRNNTISGLSCVLRAVECCIQAHWIGSKKVKMWSNRNVQAFSCKQRKERPNYVVSHSGARLTSVVVFTGSKSTGPLIRHLNLVTHGTEKTQLGFLSRFSAVSWNVVKSCKQGITTYVVVFQ